MSWDDDDSVLTSNRQSRESDDTVTIGGGATLYGGPIQFAFTRANGTAITGSSMGGSITNVVWTNIPSASSFMHTGITAGGGCYYNGTTQRVFDPAQVAALRQDFKDVKASLKRKRAEIKARKLFKRIVGDIAYLKFRQRGYHEISGPSGTRYRLEPGRWVLVMKGCADERDYELCAHLEIGIPWYDTMAVQHLMLTSSKETEEQFRKIANRHQVGYYPFEEMNRRAG